MGLVYKAEEVIHRNQQMCSCEDGIMQCAGAVKTNDCRPDQVYPVGDKMGPTRYNRRRLRYIYKRFSVYSI